ncbi:class I SAM-dependent methyltransferase [Streptantibioticus ferralitis]|uniref:Class I SAM-dependent methyltransferase n=1 Tax=Streptantibioticus ferralitis TaxID=236510 RepID=A0ABT5YYT3_9ACTN|nr:class I SAM-dependent methyltransferase [Streptantibioticus ferralitis]MDF2256762.1 class I SAM-dependent methyltransferase [Streptantibioticus ferralitis]
MAQRAATHWEPLWQEGRRYRPLDPWEEETLAHQAGLGRGRPALDVGCGEGALAWHLHRSLGYQVTALDCSPTALANAAAVHTGGGVDFRLMDFETDDLDQLPYSGYALIACRLVYRWVPDKSAFLSRIRQLLAPGGVFWVATSLHHPQGGEAKPWELPEGDTKLLTTGWSEVHTRTVGNYCCYALHL